MIRGLLHGIKRFWSRRVLTRRRYRPVYRRQCLHHAFLCRGHPSGAHVVVFVDRGDMEHVARGGYPGGGR